jgi:cobalt/nickel transport system permease protein
MVGSLFLRSYERSERVFAAMQARGFEGSLVHLEPRRIGPGEWVGLALVLAATIGLVVAAHLWLPRV